MDPATHLVLEAHPNHGYLAGLADLCLLCALLHRQSQGVHSAQDPPEDQLDLVSPEGLIVLVGLLNQAGQVSLEDRHLL